MTCPDCGGTIHGAACKLCEMFKAASPPAGTGTTTWPLVSDALAVHPRQVAKANARNAKHGIATRYQKDGRAVVPSRGDRKKLLKLEGFHDRKGGYGD